MCGSILNLLVSFLLKQSPEMADPGNDSDSEISNISGGSEMAWRPMAGTVN